MSKLCICKEYEGMFTEGFKYVESLEKHDERIRAKAEAEHKAMCESCIHKVSADDLRAIKYDAVDELSNRCITHIQESKPLTIEEIIHIIHFNADQMKGE